MINRVSTLIFLAEEQTYISTNLFVAVVEFAGAKFVGHTLCPDGFAVAGHRGPPDVLFQAFQPLQTFLECTNKKVSIDINYM